MQNQGTRTDVTSPGDLDAVTSTRAGQGNEMVTLVSGGSHAIA
jgi:hypothetical protein